MTDKLFDSFVRDKLERHSSPVPAGLWEKIIAEKKRKPKGIWWFTQSKYVILVGVILVGLPLSIYQYTKPNFIEKNTSTLNTSIKKINASTKNNTLENSNNNELSENDNQTQNLTHANQSSDISKNNSLTNDEYQNTQIEKNKNDFSRHSLFSNNKKSLHNNELRGLTNFQNYISQGISNNENDFLSPNFQLSHEALILPNSKIDYRLSIFPNLSLRRLLGINDCPSVNGKQRNDWYLELYTSPDYVNKTTQANNSSSAYIQKIDSTVKIKNGFTVGARITKTIGEHTFLKVGLQYAQINEKFNLRTENERRTTTVVVTRVISRPQGDTTFSDTTSVTQIGYRIQSNTNRYTHIELPISLGYEFGKATDKWRFTINGGAILNLSSWYQGLTLDTAYNVVSYNAKGNSGIYKRSAGLSLYASGSVYRTINDKVDIFAEPYFRYDFSNLSSSTGTSQKFLAMGLSIGTRIKLNNRKQHL